MREEKMRDSQESKGGAQVPEEFQHASAARRDVVVCHDGRSIDFHAGGEDGKKPAHLTLNDLEEVTNTFVVSLLHHKVTAINLARCGNLTDESMKAIAKGCPELKELNVLGINNLTDESMKAVAEGCPELKELNVAGIESLTDESIKAIAESCPELKDLNVLGIKKLTDESIKSIARGCPELKELNVLAIRKLTDESIKAIAKGCPELKDLNVAGIENLTDESIAAIAKGCPELKELNVLGIENLTDESIKAVAKGCPKLKELNVAGIENLTDESIKAVAKGCAELKNLDVLGIKNLTDESIKAIANGCPKLKELNVSWITNLTDESIKSIADGCPELKELHVLGIKHLTDESIKAIVKGCPKLKELSAAGIDNLTDESIKAIAKGCPVLEELNVGGIGNLTNQSIKATAEGCPELKKLDVYNTRYLTDESIKAIANGCPALKELNVSRITNLTDESIKAIANGCPRLKKLDVSWCRMGDSLMKAIVEGCPGLEELNAWACGLGSFPDDFGHRMPRLQELSISFNNLSRLPPSICKLTHLRFLDVQNNPLQSPPYEVAIHGLKAIKRYFEELEKGSSVSKLLKVVLVGDAKAGKTSLRNALAGRPKPRQGHRTIHLDIEKITLNADVDINVYDCGGHDEYMSTQLPYLTGLALYMVVVDAQYATDEYADALEGKLYRFLAVLQNRVPGAVVLPIVTKVDTVKDLKRRCHWLESKIEMWLQNTREAVCGNQLEWSSDSPQSPALPTSVADASNMQYFGNAVTHSFTPLRVQLPALAVSVKNTRFVWAVRRSVKAVRDRIIALTEHNPQILRGVGQQIPSAYVAVLKLFGAIAEYGDNDLGLEALRHNTAHALGETSKLSPHGLYRSKDDLARIWNIYCDDPNSSVKGRIFEDATQLWEAQGLIFVDAGLVVLQPEFITTIVKPLVDHRQNDENVCVLDAIAQFVESTSPWDFDCYSQLIDALDVFRASGEFDCSEESLFLSFVWRDTGLNKRHYAQVVQMLSKSGVILEVERDAGEKGTVVVVPVRLAQDPDDTRLETFWPKERPLKQRELKLHFEPRSGFPTGLAERFVTNVHGLGTSLYAWRQGVVVKNSAGCSALAECRENKLQFTVRFEEHSSEKAAWKALCHAQQILAAQRINCFPGLFYKERFSCEECCRNGSRPVATVILDAKGPKCVFRACGHSFNLVPNGKCTGLAVNYCLHEEQFNGVVRGNDTSIPTSVTSLRCSSTETEWVEVESPKLLTESTESELSEWADLRNVCDL